MACCKCCCGKKDCEEGEEGKCCCGGPSGTCCQAGEYCCSGECQPDPCNEELGACCVYTYNESEGEWSLFSCTNTTAAGCVAGSEDYASFKPGAACDDTPSPCLGDPDGTCCNGSGGCLWGGPGIFCIPTGSPGDDGCFCDDLCYLVCFDCCGADAETCCTPSPEITSLWDEYSAPGKVRIRIAPLEEGLAAYGVDMDEAWGAAMQCGACIEGYFHMPNFGRLSLVLCLQDLAAGRSPWLAVQDHQSRVRGTAGAMRAA